MHVNFSRAFSGNQKTKPIFQEAIVQYLCTQIPDGAGVRYSMDKDGNLHLLSESGPISIGGIKLVLDKHSREILGESPSFKDYLDYSYNAQKTIQFKLVKEGYMVINGVEMKANPFSPEENGDSETLIYESGHLTLTPEKFPEPFILNVGGNGYSRDLSIRRIPNDSLTKLSFESEPESPLYVKYTVDKITYSFELKISTNLTYANTIQDIIESISIYNAYIDGTGLIGKFSLGEPMNNLRYRKFNNREIEFWKHTLLLEKILNVSFVPHVDEISHETELLVEKLYQNLVNKNPIRDNITIKSISFNKNDNIEQNINKIIGVPWYTEYENTVSVELFGKRITLPGITGIINSVITNYEPIGNDIKLYLSNETDEKRMYSSTLLFLNKDDMIKYRESNQQEIIEKLRNAHTAVEYLEMRFSEE